VLLTAAFLPAQYIEMSEPAGAAPDWLQASIARPPSRNGSGAAAGSLFLRWEQKSHLQTNLPLRVGQILRASNKTSRNDGYIALLHRRTIDCQSPGC